jgi:hypothetical protein
MTAIKRINVYDRFLTMCWWFIFIIFFYPKRKVWHRKGDVIQINSKALWLWVMTIQMHDVIDGSSVFMFTFLLKHLYVAFKIVSTCVVKKMLLVYVLKYVLSTIWVQRNIKWIIKLAFVVFVYVCAMTKITNSNQSHKSYTKYKSEILWWMPM